MKGFVLMAFLIALIAIDVKSATGSNTPQLAKDNLKIYTGKVLKVMKGERMMKIHPEWKMGRGQGVTFTLDNTQEKVEIHLGPKWYLNKQGIKITPRDSVTVRGHEMNMGMRNGRKVIMAQEIIINDQTYLLRDEEGTPVWMNSKGGCPREMMMGECPWKQE